MRLWEAESAIALKMTLEDWYNLPVIEREHIVATRIAEALIENLVQKEAVENARKK